jgi:hypothetical protein
MEPIKDTIQALLAGLKDKKKTSAGSAPEELVRRIFSKQEQTHLAGRELRNGILAVDVDSSARLYHCTLHKQEILTKLRSLAPQIKDIRFRIGKV